jgi:hypothetical protein
MPSKSPAQVRLMAAVAHNPTFAKEVGVPQAVGQDFNAADQQKKAAAHVRLLRGPRGPRIPKYE